MRRLDIDIETYCAADIARTGVYRYAEDATFAVLLIAWSADGAPVQVTDVASGEELPAEVRDALTDPSVTKHAWNAAFERVCLSRWLGLSKPMSPAGWQCSMVAAAAAGLPLALGEAARALHLNEGKMAEGKALIRKFSKPNRKGERNTAADYPDDWRTFTDYCRRDVEVEQAINSLLSLNPHNPTEASLYLTDQTINDRGVAVDVQLARAAVAMDSERQEGITGEMQELTGLANPNSPVQLKQWFLRKYGMHVESLAKDAMADVEQSLRTLLEVNPAAARGLRVLELRRAAARTSVKKYEAMLDCVCADGRARGLIQMNGAARTGRWAGRLIQVQNLPQNHLDDLDGARNMVKYGTLDDVALSYPDPGAVLSQLVRTALTAPVGQTLAVCDFSAIEARVLAWLAGQKWVLDVFRSGGDIYCACASQMFSVEVTKHGTNGHLRQKGKVATLALGYGGGVAALEAMGGARLGMSPEEMADTVRRWRKANPAVVSLWDTVERAAIAAINTGRAINLNRGMVMAMQGDALRVTLPSGRNLYYPGAHVVEERNGRQNIGYMGVDQTTRQWVTLRTYGGKLTENLVQAIARDLLALVLLRCDVRGMRTVMHVHDEVVVETSDPDTTLATLNEIFSKAPEWASTLPLAGAGFITHYYKKD